MDAADIDASAPAAGILRNRKGIRRAAERACHTGQLFLSFIGGHDSEGTHGNAQDAYPDLRALDIPFHELRPDIPEALDERLPDGIMLSVIQVSLDILRERIRYSLRQDRIGLIALHPLPVPVVIGDAVRVAGIADEPVGFVAERRDIGFIGKSLKG